MYLELNRISMKLNLCWLGHQMSGITSKFAKWTNKGFFLNWQAAFSQKFIQQQIFCCYGASEVTPSTGLMFFNRWIQYLNYFPNNTGWRGPCEARRHGPWRPSLTRPSTSGGSKCSKSSQSKTFWPLFKNSSVAKSQEIWMVTEQCRM